MSLLDSDPNDVGIRLIRGDGRAHPPLAALVCVLLFFAPILHDSRAAEPSAGPPLEFLGEATWSSDHRFRDVLVGGLSAITCTPSGSTCWVLSDDRAERGPVRLFSLEINLADGVLTTEDVTFTGVSALQDDSGGDFEPGKVDPEGLVLAPDGTLWAASEGVTHQGIAPWVRQFSADGEPLGGVRIPADYLPDSERGWGVYDNLGFESLGLTPDGATLFAATENALAQDGPVSGVGVGSPARIIAWNLPSGRKAAEYLYWVDSIPYGPRPIDGLATQGVNELLALDAQSLVSLERGYVRGVGNRIRLYEVDLAGAEELSGRLVDGELEDPAAVSPAGKRLLLDLDQLGLRIDNLEGMSFGPPLPDGRRSLLLIGDNNFSDRQVTQLLAFAVRPDALRPTSPVSGLTISAIQGAGHSSPWTWNRIKKLEGTVTAVLGGGREPGFWMQDGAGDGDPATSDGIFVATGDAPRSAAGDAIWEGDSVSVDGRVVEHGRDGELTVTRIEASRVEVTDSDAPLPPPIVLGHNGRPIPPRVQFDTSSFDPAIDAADLFESVEGMRVEIQNAVVVGPTSRYGEFAVAGDFGDDLALRTGAGGARHDAAAGASPHALIVSSTLVDAPQVSVGALAEGPTRGIMHYGFGAYRIEATAALSTRIGTWPDEPTELLGGPSLLTVATFNVQNLSLSTSDARFELLGRQIVEHLGSPDILALQEIQDDSGPLDDGVVAATGTLDRLRGAILAAGGPDYDFAQIDPEDGADGGQPGGNIRVAFMFRPSRVSLERHGEPGPWDSVRALDFATGPELRPNPGRVDPAHPAFNRVGRMPHLSGSRKPLAAAFTFEGRSIFVVNNHFNSKGGDDRQFGAHQPPLALTEAQRRDQAAVVHRFAESLIAADPRARVIVLGDLNEFEGGRPIDLLAGDLLHPLLADLPPEDRYTHVYRGRAAAIDHILVSRSLIREANPEIDIVHLNADQPSAARASDHDPIVARFNFSSNDPDP